MLYINVNYWCVVGLKPGESVVVNVHTCPEWIYITFGVILAGAIPLGYDFIQNDGGDLVDTLKQLKTCAMLVLSPGNNYKNWEIVTKVIDSFKPNGEATCIQAPYLRYMIGHDFTNTGPHVKQFWDLLSDCNSDIPLPEADTNDAAALFATSGSTGSSKIAVHTHASMLSGRTMVYKGVYNNEFTFFNNDPLHWIGSFPFHLFYGQKRVTTTSLSKDELEKVKTLVHVIQEEECDVMLAWSLTLTSMLSGKVSDMINCPRVNIY